MAPKKLTDCPENLRESIDWLIQVRHGIGDGKGLEHLAKALKELIDEAIENAQKSLDDMKNQLECPPNYWLDVSYCAKKQKEIKDIEHEIERLRNDSRTNEKTLEANKSKLSTLKSEKEKHYTAYHSLSTDNREKALEDVNAKLGDLKKLERNLEAFIGNKKDKEIKSNPAADVLRSLCTGLETFLGFDPESKGYNGSGIVYSDLDRLCDAVMAFLKGVLESVKDDDAVKAYDHNRKLKIDTVIENLGSQIGQGCSGLVDSVDIVKRWLGGYESELEERTKTVVDEAQTLIKYISSHKVYIDTKPNNKFSNIDASIHGFVASADEVLKKLQNEGKTIQLIDSDLKSKLSYPIDKISQAVEALKKAAENKDLESLFKMSSDDVAKLRVRLEENVEESVKSMKSVLHKNFTSDIQDNIKIIKSDITNIATDMQAWIVDADKVVKSAIDNAKRIIMKVDLSSDNNKIKKGVESLRLKAVKLLNAYQEAYSGIDGLRRGIESAVDTIEMVYMKKLKSVRDAVVREVDEAFEESTRGFNKLDGHVKSGLVGVRKNIKLKLDNFVRDLGTALKNGMTRASGSYNDGFIAFKNALESAGLTELKGVFENVGKKNGKLAKGIDHALYNLNRDVMEWEGQSPGVNDIFQAFQTSIDGKLNEVIKESAAEIDFESRQIMQEYYAETMNEGGHVGTLRGLIKKIQSPVNAYMDDNQLNVKREKIDGLETPLTSGGVAAKGTYKAAVAKVNDALKAFEKNKSVSDAGKSNNDIQNIISLERDVLRELNEITNLVDQTDDDLTKRGVKAMLEDIHEVIGNERSGKKQNPASGFKGIKNRIDNMIVDAGNPATVVGIVAAAKTFHDETIANAVTMAIKCITSFVQAECKNLCQTIKSRAQIMYAERRKKELSELKNTVQDLVNGIEELVSIEKHNGIKGLLLKLNGTFLKKVKDLNALPETLPQGTPQTTSVLYSTTNSPLCKMGRKIGAAIRDFMLQAIDQSDIYDNQFLKHVQQTKWPHGTSAIIHLIDAFDSLLKHIEGVGHYDSTFHENLDNMRIKLEQLRPEFFSDVKAAILRPLKNGINALGAELKRGYVSTYSQAEYVEADSFNYACILLSWLPYLNNMNHLQQKCIQEWKQNNINSSNNNQLGVFLHWQGYIVSPHASKQYGELRNCTGMNGNKIMTLIDNAVKAANIDVIKKRKQTNGDVTLLNIVDYLDECARSDYLQVCHLANPSKPRYPSTIRDTLSWLGGLRHTTVFNKLYGHLTNLLKEDDNRKDAIMTTALKSQTHGTLRDTSICAYRLLIAVQGNGNGAKNAAYPYSVHYSNNHGQFAYPSDPDTLLSVLFEMITRVLPSLNFLYGQCNRTTSRGYGWADCKYGKNVSAYNSKCKDNPKSDADSHCQPGSPLQSLLMDGLLGYLPHDLTVSNNFKYTCATCKAITRGKPCIMPFGFWDIAHSGTRSGKGKDIAPYLAKLCKDADSYMNVLSRSLSFVCPVPPKNLADLFAFYYHILIRWDNKTGTRKYIDHSKFITHMETNTIKNSFPLWTRLHGNFQNTDLTNALAKICHTTEDHDGVESAGITHSDLSSLTSSSCNASLTCGPFLIPLSFDASHTFPEKHSAIYLSWLIHLPWSLRDSLNALYDAIKNISCRAYGCSHCPCSSGQHGDKDGKHPCECESAVHCLGMHPTLYSWGFTFANPYQVFDNKRTCNDLCIQLQKVIDSLHFKNLFTVIDNFIFSIRAPFIWLNVAFWLLSLLYLIHIMVIRLDLLHIKSHLRSPSSHRIAAQSLLAAGRVGRLSKISYLQP